jgi:uncharacterized RDD family membrane protein YckC
MTAPQAFRGERLGLPADGPGSIATFNQRAAAFIVDAVASALVAGLFVAIFNHHRGGYDALPRNWSLLPFALEYIVGLVLAGRTAGMYLTGIRVVRIDRPVAINPWQAFIRTLLLIIVIPAVIMDRDGRGLHDRVAGTVVVRA